MPLGGGRIANPLYSQQGASPKPQLVLVCSIVIDWSDEKKWRCLPSPILFLFRLS
jgi:hypothetical protein